MQTTQTRVIKQVTRRSKNADNAGPCRSGVCRNIASD